MVLYVLNLLHDNLKNNMKVCGQSNIGYAPMQDAGYIASFAGIKENTSIDIINSSLMNIFEILKKYNVSILDTLDILDIMLGNPYNSWIVDKYYTNNNNEELVLTSIVNDIINRDRSYVLDNLYKVSENVRNIILYSTFRRIKEENKKALINNLHDVS